MDRSIRLPPGVRDFLPQAAARRRRICRELLGTFDRWGYQRIITPQFEVAEVLERGLGPEGRRDAVRFIEPGSGDVVALRPDITPQVARIAATRLGDVNGPLRLSYEGAVTRSGARGQREILQAGIELIGAASPAGDAEAAALAAEVLLSSGVDGARLEIGHVGPSQAALSWAPDDNARDELHNALSRRDFSAVAGLSARFGGKRRALVRALPRLTGSLEAVARDAAELGTAVAKPLAEIRTTLAAAERLAPAAMKRIEVSVDLGEVRGFPYYTGIRLAGWLVGAGDAVLLGGRYDTLVARYGRDRQATGFAVDVEAVAQAQAAQSGRDHAPGGVLVARAKAADAVAARAEAIATALRRAGFRAALELSGLRGRANLTRYAEASGLGCVVVVGEVGGQRIDADGVAREVPEAALVAATRGTMSAMRSLIEGET